MNPWFPSVHCSGCRQPVPPAALRMVLGNGRPLYLCPACRSAAEGDAGQREGRWKARQCDCVFRDAEDCALFRLNRRRAAPPDWLPFCHCRCHSI